MFSEFIKYILAHGTFVDVLIVVAGVAVFGYVMVLRSQVKRNRKRNDMLLKKYNVLNTAVFGLHVGFKAATGISILKESADSDGEFSLNWDLDAMLNRSAPILKDKVSD